MACAMSALHWRSRSHGYEIATTEVQDAREALLAAANNAGVSEREANARVEGVIDGSPAQKFMRTSLQHPLFF